jgi:hypothetical protein
MYQGFKVASWEVCRRYTPGDAVHLIAGRHLLPAEPYCISQWNFRGGAVYAGDLTVGPQMQLFY